MFSPGLRTVITVVLISVAIQDSYAEANLDTKSAETLRLALESAVSTAIKENPNLASIQQRYEALTHVPSQVSTLPDPVVTLGAMNFASGGLSRSQEPMTQVKYGISQAFPFPGKLKIKKEIAEIIAESAGFSLEEAHNRLIKDVRMTWWDIFYVDRALETLSQNQELFRKLIDVTKTKYETGDGLQQDVLLAQLELSRLLDQEIKLKAIRQTHADRLNVLMARAPTIPVLLKEIEAEPMNEAEDVQSLMQAALANRPFLKKAFADVDTARSRLALARRDYFPDFTLGLSYGDRIGANPDLRARDDLVSLSVGVRIPLYAKSKQSKAVSQRTSELNSQMYAAKDAENEIYGMISSLVTQYEKAKDEFSLYETGILPQASQTVESMQAGYQVNQVDFLNLIRSQITLLNYELLYWKSYTEAKQSLASLEAVVGKENIYE